MTTTAASNIALNPEFINSGFRSQARNISSNHSLSDRKIACLMQSVSQHILKHGAHCYASTYRLLSLYNQYGKNYGVSSVSERTLYNMMKKAERLQLIKRGHQHNHSTGQTLRLITLGLTAIAKMFSGVYNYASSCAEKRVNRQKVQSGRSTVDNSSHPRTDKGLSPVKIDQSCSKRSKDLSKERKINISRTPSDSFYLKWFGKDADNAKSLQLSAKQGRITGKGAKALIHLHTKYGYELAKSFKHYLNFVICQDRQANVSNPAHKQAVTLPKQTNEVLVDCWAKKLEQGRAEYVRDSLGRIQVQESAC